MSDCMIKREFVDYPGPPKPIGLPGELEVSSDRESTELVVFFGATSKETEAGLTTKRTHGEWRRLFPKEERGPIFESDIVLKIKLENVFCVLETKADVIHDVYDFSVLDLVRGTEKYSYPFVVELMPPQIPLHHIIDESLASLTRRHFFFYTTSNTIDALASGLSFEWAPNPYSPDKAGGGR